MPINKTINFLPSVFQSDTNRKFLNATLDQLVTEPNVATINGYVGRKFSPGFTDINSYIKEPSADRANYQLEPGIAVKNSTSGNVEYRTSYVETLQQISQLGGRIDNQDRLWKSDFYTYDPKINVDAFINFSQYYWLPSGPDPVHVFANTAELQKTFYIYPNDGAGVYNVNGYGVASNPDIVLARGGTYTFNVNQKGHPFYIQTNPGITGKQTANPSLSSRQVLGVTNNGDEVGTVTFIVPDKTAQDFFINMNVVQTIDFVTPLPYSLIQGQSLTDFNTAYGGFDGQTSNVNGKYLIFGTYTTEDADWTVGSTVPINQRYGIWQINIVSGIINLSYVTSIPTNKKVIVQSGVTYGNTEWYTTPAAQLVPVPPITATMDVLYYQDGVNPTQYGTIRLIDQNNHIIDVETEILNKTNYVSPNGVIFTNGLKIKFDTSVIPASYQNKEFYVDGVGKSIVLTPVEALTVNYAQPLTNYNPANYFTGAATAVLSAARDQFTITTSDVPANGNISAGTFPNSVNTNYIIDQNLTVTYPYRGGLDTQGDHNSIQLESGSIGMSMAGILINGVSNDWYIDGTASTRWHYNAPEVKINGDDSYGGVVLSDGSYVYKNSSFITANAWGNLSGFSGGSYTHADGHSKIIGFAKDGYPIYGPFGYVNPSGATSSTVRLISSYVADATSASRPAPVKVSVAANAYSTSLITVSSTYGLNPGMRITVNSGGLTSGSAWIINNGLHTAVGPDNFAAGTTQVQLNTPVTVYAGQTLTFEFLPGAFIEDYSYVPDSGSLDQFNGRFCVTPDFPFGTYAYFATQDITGKPTYPYFVGKAFYGSTAFDTNSSLAVPDYIIINRSSRDLNPWSRRNRWFHKDVIEATATYNNTVALLDQTERASRPIIEFIPNLQLFNFGKNGLAPVDLYDTRYTQPFLQVEGQRGVTIDGIQLVQGMRVIFAADSNPDTRGKIWDVSFVDPYDTGNAETHLTLTVANDGHVVQNDTVSVYNGIQYAGGSFWYNGTAWVQGQTKTTENQPPLFDVYDLTGTSFGDRSKYPVTNSSLAFNGTKIFGYKVGTGASDPVLGFPLTYKNFNNIGDIQFQNNFDTDTFLYTIDPTNYTDKVNSGLLYLNNIDGSVTKLNVWAQTTAQSRQYQDIPYIYDGVDNTFNIDITPDVESDLPNLLVYVNYKKLSTYNYQVLDIPTNRKQIVINPTKIVANDKIDILVYSSSLVSKLGYYVIPDNLNLNAHNDVIETPTLGELRNHISSMASNSLLLSGEFPGSSNLRDLYVVSHGGTMLQQSAPISYAALFLGSETNNFVNSLFNAQHEYSRFKNKFLSLASGSHTASYIDAVTAVDNILKQINLVKNKNFAWYYSDMVPYGDNKNTIVYNVYDPAQRRYETTSIFSNATLSNQAILVYLNGTQLLYGTDYTFLETAPGVLIGPDLTIEVNDTLTIVEYHDTDGNWIPETPTKLGLYPKFSPVIYTDNTYVTPTKFIKGHDGSLTPAFNDFRDDLLLELERRIYNNIKVSYDEKLFSIYNSIPGKFRNTGYSLAEFNTITLKTYLQWTSMNRLDYTRNDSFISDNPFTYNYSGAIDVIDGANLPGSWRACFEYFYDTQRPNTDPWEMLGFHEQPSWWESYYGPAPYTSGNSILWNDLEAGYIADGDRKGYDSKFARPGLLNIIPVDDSGDLLAPIGLLTQDYNFTNFNSNWSVGQLSPTETAWTNSSDYPFAVMYAAAITQPAKFFGLGIAPSKYKFNTELNQYLVTDTNQRLTPADINVNGYVSSAGTITRAAGYLNWIGDYLISGGMSTRDGLVHYARDYTVQLTYRMAGFSGKEYLKVLAEQNSPTSQNDSIIIPDADYDVLLTKSAPLSNPKYSAVIVEKTTSGFKISGYDTLSPYFTIIPYTSTGRTRAVTVLKQSVAYPLDFTNYKISIAYGTEFSTLNSTTNFLASYERYLKSQGFRFDYYDENLGQIRNWELSTKEFLFWAQQGWKEGSIIVLSPVADKLFLNIRNASVDAISNSFYGTKVMTQNYATLQSDAYSVARDTSAGGNSFKISLDNTSDLIAFADLDLVQYEHSLIFNNTTQFNDIIYNPVTGQRQYRLKIVGSKTNNWTGMLAADGFIYNAPDFESWHQDTDYLRGDLVDYKNFFYAAKKDLPGTTEFNSNDWLPVDKSKLKTGLLSNFSRNAGMSVDFYNVDKVNVENEFDRYALGLIGFRSRDYLSALGLDDTTQVKFYQGFIKEKGTKNAINALATTDFNKQAGSIEINEEWALRVGEYGSLDTNQFVELLLDENYTLNNPTSLEVLSDSFVRYSSLYTENNKVYNTSTTPWKSPFFINRSNSSNYKNDIQTAGFVNIEDVDYTLFDLNDKTTLSAELDNIGTGSTIWVAKDYAQEWNVYRVGNLSCKIVSYSNALDNNLLMTTDINHGLSLGDTVILKNLDRFSGFYKIEVINSLTTFTIKATQSTAGTSTATASGLLYKLISVKFDRASQITTYNPKLEWHDNDKAWVRYNDTDENWAVYNKSTPWSYNSPLNIGEYDANGKYGSSVKLSPDNNFALAGKPGYNSGVGAFVNYVRSQNNTLVENLTLTSIARNTSGMGFSLDSGVGNVVVGAPSSASNIGYAFVYHRTAKGELIKQQVLSTNAASSKFGYSVAMSTDDQWVYIGQPGTSSVVVYAYDSNVSTYSQTVTKSNSSATLSFTPSAAELLFVANATVDFVPYVDYTISGNKINFTSNSASGSIQVTQQPGYRQITTISGNTSSQFGYSLATSAAGDQIVIGAPTANLSISNVSTNSGTVSVYDRSIEKYISYGNTKIFSTTTSLPVVPKVYINNVLKTLGTDYRISGTSTVVFANAVPAASVVQIDTSSFNLIKTLSPTTPYANQQFGYSVDICPTQCSIYVGAPYQSSDGFYNGAVYRFINQAKIYGTITGTTLANNVITPGTGIRINDRPVIFNDSKLSSIVSTINSAGIPGITAANTNGYLSITSTSTLALDKMTILPGVGSAITTLGLDVFVESQKIQSPSNINYNYFGKVVKINSNSDALFVASDNASNKVTTIFDDAITIFDAGSVRFEEYLQNTGSVWVYNYLNDSRNSVSYPGLFVYSQQLNLNNNLLANTGYGAAIDVTDYKILVGANTDSSIFTNAGKVYQFNNPDKLLGWDVYRSQEPKVDIDSLLKAFIYSSTKQTIINNLDHIDPAKGKILGVAEQDISYKTDYDPAVYNNATDTSVSYNTAFSWSEKQVGQVWWDLSTVRFLDYEQGSIKYRTANWGRTFPNSSIDIYEWVESSYPPNQYVARGGNGVPKYSNNTAYVTINYVDPLSGQIVSKYYFWVKDKTAVDKNQFGRTIPTSTIAEYISNPKSSGISYYAALRNDSVAVFNVLNYVTGSDTILHIDYASQINNNIIHSEYALLSETNSRSDLIPQSIYNKLLDSASGLDTFGNPVPDPKLPVQSRYGISIRPRQSMFMDKDAAVKSMVVYVNSIFANNIISQGFNLSTLSSGESLPPAGIGEYDTIVGTYAELLFLDVLMLPVGYKVLVDKDETVSNLWTIYTKQSDNSWLLSRVQSYRTSDYWEFVDWYAPGFNSSVKPNYTVNTFADLSNIALKSEDIVKIKNNGKGKWVLVQVFPNIVTTIGIESGTIALTDNLYNLADNGMGFDNDNFGASRFDQSPGIELRKILQALKEDIFINELSQDFVNLFFVFVYYVLNEQKYTDWIFKTSFIDVLHKFKGLDQPQIYNKDNLTYYQQYIEEVKPYRTTIREYVTGYTGSDNFNGYTSDFDVPAYYDNVLHQYRSPSGDFVQDTIALQGPEYYDWLMSYPSVIASIDVVDGGSGYTVEPQVTITGSTIGNNAVARALISNGVVSKIEVLYSGSNYIQQPVITVSGGNGSGARVYARLQNETVRKLKTTLVYDRYTFNTTVQIWEPYTLYNQGDIITYKHVAYIANNTFTSGATFNGNNLSVYPSNKFNNANDRIQAYYDPGIGSIGKDLSLLQSGINYPGVTVEGPLFTDSGSFDVAAFDESAFDPSEIDADGQYVISGSLLDTKLDGGGWTVGKQLSGATGIDPGEILVDGGEYISTYGSYAPEELLPGRVFDTLNMNVYTLAVIPSTADYRAWANTKAFYVANITVIDGGAGYSRTGTTISVTGGGSKVSVTAQAAATFDANGTITSINVITNGLGYTETPTVLITGANTSPARASLGVAPYDVTVGIPISTFGYRISKSLNSMYITANTAYGDSNVAYDFYKISSVASTTLAQDLTLTANTIVVTDSSVLSDPSPADAMPGVVYINGERITYWQKFNSNNTLSQIRRATAGTGAKAHAAGSTVWDTGSSLLVPQSGITTYTSNANAYVQCTDSVYRNFYANIPYLQSTLWLSRGTLPVDITAETFIANTANVIISEDSIDSIGTEGGGGPDIVTTPTDGAGLYASTKLQAIFVRTT